MKSFGEFTIGTIGGDSVLASKPPRTPNEPQPDPQRTRNGPATDPQRTQIYYFLTYFWYDWRR